MLTRLAFTRYGFSFGGSSASIQPCPFFLLASSAWSTHPLLVTFQTDTFEKGPQKGVSTLQNVTTSIAHNNQSRTRRSPRHFNHKNGAIPIIVTTIISPPAP